MTVLVSCDIIDTTEHDAVGNVISVLETVPESNVVAMDTIKCGSAKHTTSFSSYPHSQLMAVGGWRSWMGMVSGRNGSRKTRKPWIRSFRKIWRCSYSDSSHMHTVYDQSNLVMSNKTS